MLVALANCRCPLLPPGACRPLPCHSHRSHAISTTPLNNTTPQQSNTTDKPADADALASKVATESRRLVARAARAAFGASGARLTSLLRLGGAAGAVDLLAGAAPTAALEAGAADGEQQAPPSKQRAARPVKVADLLGPPRAAGAAPLVARADPSDWPAEALADEAWANAEPCEARADGATATTTATGSTTTAGAAAAAPHVADGFGRLWGWERNRSCAFKDDDDVPYKLVEKGAPLAAADEQEAEGADA